jgi:PIN domain nuclease of toxin-antitoxin system
LRLLLDTHALIWALNDHPKLSARTRALLLDPQVEQCVSAVSVMEIFTKHRRGKLPEAEGIVADWDELMAAPGYTWLPVTPAQARLAGSLAIDHKDPFDRLLIAQSILEQAPLLSNEKLFDSFGVERIW